MSHWKPDQKCSDTIFNDFHPEKSFVHVIHRNFNLIKRLNNEKNQVYNRKEVNDEPKAGSRHERSRNGFSIMTQNMQTQSSLVIVHLFSFTAYCTSSSVSVSRALFTFYFFNIIFIFYELEKIPQHLKSLRESPEVRWREIKTFLNCNSFDWRLNCKKNTQERCLYIDMWSKRIITTLVETLMQCFYEIQFWKRKMVS